MALNENDVSPPTKNVSISSCDYSPRERALRQPFTQNRKVFKSDQVFEFDVPDFSTISDAASEIGNVLPSKILAKSFSENPLQLQHYQERLSPRIPSDSFNPPINSVDSENGINVEHVYESLPCQQRLLKSSDCPLSYNKVHIFNNDMISNEHLSIKNIDVNRNSHSCRKSTGSVDLQFNYPASVQDECSLIESPIFKKVGNSTGSFGVQSVRKSSSKIPTNTEKCACHNNKPTFSKNFQASKNKNAVLHENKSRQKVPSAYSPNCLEKLNSSSDKITVCTKYPSRGKVEIVNECLIEKPGDVREYLTEQDKKLIMLQDQITALQPKECACCATKDADKENEYVAQNRVIDQKQFFNKTPLSENNQCQINEISQNFVLRYLKEHGDHIHRLQNQIDLLMKRTEELESFHLSKDKSYIASETNVSSNDNECGNSSVETDSIKVDKDCQTNEDELHLEQTQTKQTSTSTMTSLTFEGGDKLGFRKKLTVVTKCQKDVSMQCSQIASSFPAHTEEKKVAKDIDSPQFNKDSKRNKNRTPKSADLKKQKGKTSIQNKTLNQSKKCEQELCQQNHSIDLNADCNGELYTESPRLRENGADNASPLLTGNREDEWRSEFQSPLYQSIVKNINQLILEDDNRSYLEPSSPGIRNQKSCPRQQNSYKAKTNACPSLSPAKRNTKYHKSSSRSSSNSSSDSFQRNPRHRNNETESDSLYSKPLFHDSSTISKYGLSSPNLSVATKQYLENYGLVRSQNPTQDTDERNSSKKSKTPRCRRQIL